MEIRPYDKNAKKHPQSQLKALAAIVALVGWRQPVLVNQEGVIVAGHGRWATYQEYREEYNLKPIWVMDDKGQTIAGEPEQTPLTAELEEAYRLADNKLNESEWDMNLVIPTLKGLSLEMIDLTGFSRDLILEDDDKDDQVGGVPNTPRSKTGDHYILGEHHLLVGDSTQFTDVHALVADHAMDMVFTDPPYNINYHGGGKNTSNGIENDNMDDQAFDLFLTQAFDNYHKIVKKGAGIYVFHDAKTAHQFERALIATGFEVKTHMIWNKPSAGLGMGDYRRKHEPFLYAAVKDAKPNFYGGRSGNASVVDLQKSEAQLFAWVKKQKKMEQEGKTSIWSMKRENVADYVHPTQKPVELITYALANSSKEGDLVADLFLGSGSTLIACQKAGRVCYGMEMDPGYADVIVDRYTKYVANNVIVRNEEIISW